MWNRILPLIILLFTYQGFACHSINILPQKSSININKNDLEQEILFYINQYRTGLQKPPLKLLPAVSAIAWEHSLDMAAGKAPFGHEGFDERCNAVFKLEPTAKSIGENVAYGNISAQEIVGLWIKSIEHRKNLEGDFNFTGIGIARSKAGILFITEIYLKK